MQHPTDPQDFNRYAYARNNPIKYNDPTGFGFFTKLFAFIGAIIGNAILPGIGAVIGGAIGGSLGGLVDGAIANQKLGKAAIQGMVEGAIIGAGVAISSQGGVPGGGGGGTGSPQIEILIKKEVEKYAQQWASKAVEKMGVSSQGHTILENIFGSTLAYAGESDKSTHQFSINVIEGGEGSNAVKEWGHTYLTLKNSFGNTLSFGWYPYPSAGREAIIGKKYAGIMARRDHLRYLNPDATMTWDITKMQFDQVVSFAKAYEKRHGWCLADNCTTFAAAAARFIGIQVPNVQSYGNDDPNKMSEWIKGRDKK